MKKIYTIAVFSLLAFTQTTYAQNDNDTIVYLLTCKPGTETYSIYGHSAIRIVDRYSGTDIVYNWGVFDFTTPNFTWKFAKGRLDYMLERGTMDNFLRIYHYEERGVISQRINLEPASVMRLVELINENLKPENVKYRYDFFYDNCATRIRDMLENAADGKIHYPPDINGLDTKTFRNMIDEYQKPYQWLKLGINIALGLPCDKKVSFRQKMFLPLELQKCLNETVILTDGRLVPLLQNPEILVNYNTPVVKSKTIFSPEIIFALILILIISLTPFIRKKAVINSIDIFIFLIFSILAGFMLFFNFITDHHTTKMNLHIVWLNPFIILCLISLITNKTGVIWFRISFYLSILFLVAYIFRILPQEVNAAVAPACLLLAYKSLARSKFAWNPFAIDEKRLI